MITDIQLYELSSFLATIVMVLIVFYHFLEVNARPEKTANASQSEPSSKKGVDDGRSGKAVSVST